MSQWLKQSTTVTIQLGPFLDDGDGKTAETGLTISQADVRLSKGGAAFAQATDANAATHDEAGWYRKQLDTTDTGTLGRLIVAVAESGALPVWREFMVVPANEYDSLVSGTDALQVDAVEVSGDSTAADNAESFFDGTGYAGTNNVIPTVTTLTGHTAQTGDSFARLGAPAGASVSADVAAVQADTDDIQTRLPAALVGGRIDANVGAISADATAADNLELDYDGTGYAKGNSTIGTTTTNTDMRGTDNAALASVVGALADAAAAGDPTSADTIMQYVKQLINILAGTAGITTFPAEAAPGNAVSLAEVIRAIHVDVTGLNGDAMRGTDSAALAATALTNATWTDARAGYVDNINGHTAQTGDSFARLGAPAGVSVSADVAANQADLNTILADTNELQTDWANGGRLDNLLDGASAPTAAQVRAEIDSNSTQLAAIVADTNELQTDWANGGRLDNLLDGASAPSAATVADAVWDEAQADHVAAGSFGEVATETAAILTDTAVIGAAGAGLTALPWNSAWDTEVQSECTDALNAYDPPTKAELDTAVANVSVDEIQATAVADLFNTDSGTNYAGAVAGSVVKETADNAGGSSLTEAGIADAVWDETLSGHLGAGSTGTALNGASAPTAAQVSTEVWSAASRTLTQSAASVVAAVSGSDITVPRLTTWSISLTGLGDISSRTALYLTVKDDFGDTDATALFQVEETAGLLYLDGAAASDSADGTLTVDDQALGNVTITTTTDGADLAAGTYSYDIKMVTASTVEQLTTGKFRITSVVTRTVA